MRGLTLVVTLLILLSIGCAIFSFKAAAQFDTGSYYSQRNQLDSLVDAANYNAAYELAYQLNRYYGLDSYQWWLEGRLAASINLWDEAAAALTRSMELGSVYEDVTARRIAEAHARAGRQEEALDWLAVAIEHGLARRFDLPDNSAFEDFSDEPRLLELAGLRSQPVEDRTTRWQRDIDFLVEETQRMHAAPKSVAQSRAFLDAADQLKASVGSMSDARVLLEIRRLVVMLGDAHSYVRRVPSDTRGLQPPAVDNDLLPVFFHPFEEDIYIINGTGEGSELVGGKVVSFGKMPVAEFVTKSLPFVHQDNSETWKFIGVQFVYRSLGLHQHLGTADGDKLRIRVMFDDGRIVEKSLAGGSHSFPRKLRPMPGQTIVPEFLTHVDSTYRGYLLDDAPVYYAQVNNIQDARKGPSLSEFMSQAVSDALAGEADNFVLDLRLNNGGNNFLCDGVVTALQRFEDKPGGQLFVVTRHETFSAAQNCSNRIEAATEAIFVGEPSSSRPNFVGEESEVMLPYSGLEISLSNRYWQDSQPWDNRPWIEIDLPAPLTFQAYSEGRDPAMEAILDLCCP